MANRPQWWELPIIWWLYRRYKRADRKEFRRECDGIRWRTTMRQTEEREETMATVFDTLRDDVASIFEKHRGEVEKVISDAEQVATNPVAQQIGGLVHIPAGALRLFGAFAAALDGELAKVLVAPSPTAPPTPAAPAAPVTDGGTNG